MNRKKKIILTIAGIILLLIPAPILVTTLVDFNPKKIIKADTLTSAFLKKIYTPITSGWIDGESKYYKSQPNISDPTYKKVSNGFVKNSKYLLEQPELDDETYKAVNVGYVEDPSNKYYAIKPNSINAVFMKTGWVLSGDGLEGTDYLKDNPNDDEYIKLPTSEYPGVWVLFNSDGSVEEFSSQYPDNPYEYPSGPSWNVKKYKEVKNGYVKNGNWFKDQGKIKDQSWTEINKGFVNDQNDYLIDEPFIKDASYTEVTSGYINEGKWYKEKPIN